MRKFALALIICTAMVVDLLADIWLKKPDAAHWDHFTGWAIGFAALAWFFGDGD